MLVEIVEMPTGPSASGWQIKEEWQNKGRHGKWYGRFSGVRPGSGVPHFSTHSIAQNSLDSFNKLQGRLEMKSISVLRVWWHKALSLPHHYWRIMMLITTLVQNSLKSKSFKCTKSIISRTFPSLTTSSRL